jgi:hypothetical protein
MLQCTEVELLRIRCRTHHEAGVGHEQIIPLTLCWRCCLLLCVMLQCTEVELLRIRYRTHHEAGVSHEQISTEALNALRERMRQNGQADQM